MSDYELKEASRVRKSYLGCLLNVAVVALICIAVLVAVPLSVRLVRVQGDSMAPSLQGGELLLVNRLAYRFTPLQRGDIIVLQSPEESDVVVVKRVIALPGERVSIRRGVVSVNDANLDEPYVADQDTEEYGPAAVKDGTIFVLGDHRSVSNDSREWGGVPVGNIIGRVEFSIWPTGSTS